MNEITFDALRKVYAYAFPHTLHEHLPYLNAAAVRAQIDSVARWAMWLAQIGHETGELRYMQELWGPTPQQRRYSPPSPLARHLGNLTAEDGPLYRGRGALQLTGRANYEAAGKALGLPLLAQPWLAATPSTCYLVAAWFWQTRSLNNPSDSGDIEEVTRRINGGLNGLAHRWDLFKLALDVLNRSDAVLAQS